MLCPLSLLLIKYTVDQRGDSKAYFLAHLCHVLTATIFTVKNPAEENLEGEKKEDEEEDDFQTDEDEEMEVDNQVLQKRKKVCRNLKNIFFFCLYVLVH